MAGDLRDIPAAADVVVLGGGAAGLMAAVAAADRGAATILFDKEPELGGSTRLSGGYVALCETDLQPGTCEELFADLMASHHYDCDESLSRLYAEEAPGVYEDLRGLGVRFAGTMQFSNMSRPWGHELPTGSLGGGAQIVDHLQRAASTGGVRIVTGAAARRIVREPSGEVTAVLVETASGTGTVAARTAVVVATGGFTRNPELIKTYGRPGTEDIVPITGPGSHGDGLVLGLALGAATSYIGRGVAPTGPVEPHTGAGCVVNYAGGVIVNKEGRRFCDESALYVDLCWAGLQQTDRLMIHVFDEAARAAYATTMVGQVMSGGDQFQADSLEALTAQLHDAAGVDAGEAVAAVQRYNAAIAAGAEDECGRRHLIGSAGTLVPLATPPYFAVVCVPGTTHFNGGLKVNDRMEVVDLFGDAITRLYAAGEVTGGFHGSGYMPATHVGSALIFGRRAGRSAAVAAVLSSP